MRPRCAAARSWSCAVSGGLAAFVAAEYRSTFSGAIVARPRWTALAENPAIRTLFGPPVALDDPGGFTVWRTGTVLAVLVGVWGALAATRLTRGEEEAGRWDLLLAGRLRLPALVRAHARRPARATALARRRRRRWACCSPGPRAPGALLFGALIAGTGMAGAALGVLGGAAARRAPAPPPGCAVAACCSPACWRAWSPTACRRWPGCSGSARSG